MEKIVVVGLGYVGIPVAAAFADAGLNVVGVDIDKSKVESINRGDYPIRGNEPGIAEMIARTVNSGRLSAAASFEAVAQADAVTINVQTPFDVEALEPRYSIMESALRSVGEHLKRGTLVIIESTIAPTTMERLVRPVLEESSGLVAGNDFLLGHCPERVMPGRLLQNLIQYDRVLGADDAETHEKMLELYKLVVKGNLTKVSLKEAEVVKTFENTYRDVEIALANEFARYCDVLGVDFFNIRSEVNRVVDRNLHLPGVGVGGHCIPKDTYLLAYGTKGKFTPELMLASRRLNDAMPGYVAQRTLEALGGVERPQVTLLGYSYLGDSDDTRNTPAEPLAAALEAGGALVRVHDSFAASPTRQIESDVQQAIAGADAVVVTTAHSEYAGLDLVALGKTMRQPLLVDARRVFGRAKAEAAGFQYVGLGD